MWNFGFIYSMALKLIIVQTHLRDFEIFGSTLYFIS